MLLVLRRLAIGMELRHADWVWGGVSNLGALEAVGVVEQCIGVLRFGLCMLWRSWGSKAWYMYGMCWLGRQLRGYGCMDVGFIAWCL
jgi:hypothetical protein